MTSINQASFTGGEISPNLYSRVDLARWMNSLKTCRNFITQPYGGAKNRSGTRYIATAKGAGRLIPFRFNSTQQYVLEFTDLNIRVYRDRVFKADIYSPYTLSELSGLKFTQSADVITICHPNHEPMNLSRVSDVSWTLAALAPTTGPWLELNLDNSLSVYAGASVGTVTLTASKDLFYDKHVGRLFYMEQRTYGQPWEVQKDIVAGDIRRSDGKYYKAMNAGKTGTLRPTHTTDTWSDGGINWLYLHAGYGIARIKAILTTKTATATVISVLPDEASSSSTGFGTSIPITGATNNPDGRVLFTTGARSPETITLGMAQLTLTGPTTTQAYVVSIPDNTHFVLDLAYNDYIAYMPAAVSLEPPATSGKIASDRWKFGAWGGDQGWPSVVTYYQGRRVFANGGAQPQTVWMTRSNAYNDYSQSTPIQDDDALTFTLTSGQLNAIKGIIAMGQLVMLTSGSEWVLSAGQGEVTTPGNIATKVQGFRGSSDLEPLGAGDTVLYVQDKGQVVRDLGYEWQSNKFTGNDLTVFADHLVEGKVITGWAYQQHPFGIVWMVRNDGVLLGMTYMREQQVFGWHHHDFDGTVESVCCISETVDGVQEDALYLTINRSTGRFIERMESRLVTDITKAFFVDCGITYSGPATTSIPGLSHIEGKTVSALFDGFVAKGLVVSGGQVTLPHPGSLVHVGLPITADIQTLDVANPQGETLSNKKKAINSVSIQVLESRSIWAGRDATHLYENKARTEDVPYASPVRLQDGVVTIPISTSWGTSGSVFIRQTDPLPLTITAITPEVTIGGL